MARVWQEGFEDGLPNSMYIEGNLGSTQFKNFFNDTIVGYDSKYLDSGRNVYSRYSLAGTSTNFGAVKKLETPIAELYHRAYVKITQNTTIGSRPFLALSNSSNTVLIGIYCSATSESYTIKVLKSGTLSIVATFTLSANIWYKIDVYYKSNSSTGAYEVRIDDVNLISESSLNTGTHLVDNIAYCRTPDGGPNIIAAIDDLAINDTTGAVNNSWCGSGTIVALKPKGAGNSSQWDTSQGYTVAENGTSTTNIEITSHGLATNDVIYNKTRDAYRIITKVDDNNFTVSSVTSQAENDIIICFTYAATITAGASTTAYTILVGHTLVSYDVTVNASRSNAIRRVLYVMGSSVYNSATIPGNSGATVSGQTAGDTIKTFKVKQYAITNHWETVSKSDPNPQICNIQTTTSGDIDLFDMTELTADLGIPSTATIVAVSANIYAQEAGAGSQIKPVLRISGTNYEGSTISLSSGTLEYQAIYDVNPATSAAFTRAAIDAIEAGVKLV